MENKCLVERVELLSLMIELVPISYILSLYIVSDNSKRGVLLLIELLKKNIDCNV